MTSTNNARRLTRVQRIYLLETERRGHLEFGEDGYRSTVTVRILEERGLITLGRNHHAGAPWCITGLTKAGALLLEAGR